MVLMELIGKESIFNHSPPGVMGSGYPYDPSPNLVCIIRLTQLVTPEWLQKAVG